MAKLTDKQIEALQARGYHLYESPDGTKKNLYHPVIYRLGINALTGDVFYQKSKDETVDSAPPETLIYIAETCLTAARYLLKNDKAGQKEAEGEEPKTETRPTNAVPAYSDEPRVAAVHAQAVVSVRDGSLYFNQKTGDIIGSLFDAGYVYIVPTKDSTAVYLQFRNEPAGDYIRVREVTSEITGRRAFTASRADVVRQFFGACEKTEQYDAELLADKKTIRLTQYFTPIKNRIVR